MSQYFISVTSLTVISHFSWKPTCQLISYRQFLWIAADLAKVNPIIFSQGVLARLRTIRCLLPVWIRQGPAGASGRPRPSREVPAWQDHRGPQAAGLENHLFYNIAIKLLLEPWYWPRHNNLCPNAIWHSNGPLQACTSAAAARTSS